jgi:NAD(P)-dependent dehydrogenase (short-subunit alcohol dehydrogenase family)
MAFNIIFTLEAIVNIAKEVLTKHRRVDYLVNIAGYILKAAVKGMSP